MRKPPFLIGTLLISLLLINHGNATKMLHRNVEELTSLSERIFVGVCVFRDQKRLELKNGSFMAYTEYTFETLQSIKGVSQKKIILRQVGLSEGRSSIIGMPAYETDKKYLLFLREDSGYGLASPIGLGQGAFKIFRAGNGADLTVNAFGNRGLFHRMNSTALSKSGRLTPRERAMLSQTHGPVNLENLVGLIKNLSK